MARKYAFRVVRTGTPDIGWDVVDLDFNTIEEGNHWAELHSMKASGVVYEVQSIFDMEKGEFIKQ